MSVNEQVCGYFFIWGYYKHSSKQTHRVHISLYAAYVLNNSFISFAHLGKTTVSLYLPGCLEGYLTSFIITSYQPLNSWPDKGRISVWEFENLDRRKTFFLMTLLCEVNYYGFLS